MFICIYNRSQVSVYRTIGPLVYSSRIRTLVAMVTVIFLRLIMGKVEISYFLKTIAAWDLKSGRCKQLMD